MKATEINTDRFNVVSWAACMLVCFTVQAKPLIYYCNQAGSFFGDEQLVSTKKVGGGYCSKNSHCTDQ